MTVYHKIDSVFLRDPDNKFKTFLEGQWVREEFGYLANNEWEWQEKVDGTNIRIMVKRRLLMPPEIGIEFGGKTDSAQIPTILIKRLQDIFFPQTDKLHEMFPQGAVLYGEGHGAGIQKGGGNYRPDQNFVLFDVNVTDAEGKGWWLKRPDVLDVADKLDLTAVPVIGWGSLHEMIQYVKAGFPSTWATDKNPFMAEGIVARPKVELIGRDGKRIITKVKYKDFVRDT